MFRLHRDLWAFLSGLLARFLRFDCGYSTGVVKAYYLARNRPSSPDAFESLNHSLNSTGGLPRGAAAIRVVFRDPFQRPNRVFDNIAVHAHLPKRLFAKRNVAHPLRRH